MKYLLYSKSFKKNLAKWLGMYLGMICLFTVVVTYSRYISNLTSSEEARVAKFNVEVTYDDVCNALDSSETCNYGSIRPTSSLVYYFTVDTTELEVNTLFVTNVMVDNDFNNYRLYDVTNGEILYVEDDDYTISDGEYIDPNNGQVRTYKILSIVEDINASSGYKRKYKLIIDYKNVNSYSVEYNYDNVVVVGYSAIQK